ncbi:MAG: FAD-binding oxidoreductase [Chitinophagaceae bacterium]|nr:FAD-binding oxidoreductase [Chitinophagaceae bacterium]MCW5928128.1 FAD-binding oxidoreductase [Chitinophagaceae bacterium]
MKLLDALRKVLPEERIKSRLIDRLSYASDAGFYQLIPQAVVQPADETEIKALFAVSRETGTPLVFRTGGSSLSGQSITDGILADLSQHWGNISVDTKGKSVTVQPGITGAMVNAVLKKWNVKIGPDPSSISTAMMGGILSNNASGMCCGVKYNSYHTARRIRFILPDGRLFDTAVPADYPRFEEECRALCDTLKNIQTEIHGNSELLEKIRHKYRTKNTVGYSLNALVDYRHPLDVFAHLLIGAEGTLAFIAEATMDTIPDLPYKSTALLYFPDIFSACSAIEPLIAAGAEMVELMDRASLRSVENMKGMDPLLKTLPETAAALLVEFQEETEEQLNKRVSSFLGDCSALPLINPPAFTRDEKQRDFFWKVRKGMFPAVGAVRKSGTTVILEDVAFPLPVLGHAILDLQKLFLEYQYDNAIIFGHAKDGNIHFVVTQAFDSGSEIIRYDKFLRDVVELVVKKYNGTLKAEHGTGRNMAPFVETEWGGEAYAFMKRIKQSADPHHLLNPGVIINDDKEVHIKNLKPLPSVEPEVDKCIECGYCEPVCPSRNLTLTPRRRIVVRRALKQLKGNKENTSYNELLRQYQYDGLDTCSVDGLCAIACPVDINTGDLVKRLRRENHSLFANRVAMLVAKNFRMVEKCAQLALSAGTAINRVAGKNSMLYLTRTIRKLLPSFPLWNRQLLPPPSLKKISTRISSRGTGNTIVYFSACISRLMGAAHKNGKSLPETFMSVSQKAGINVIVSNPMPGACCGQIFSSKGYDRAYRYTAEKIITQLWELTQQGKHPVVMDVSSCTYTLKNIRPALPETLREKFDALLLMDSVDYLHDMVLQRVAAKNKKEQVVLHPVCSLHKMGIDFKFRKIAAAFAEEVVVPLNAGCCGMAGDRGFLFPELTASATAPEAAEVKTTNASGYYSSTKTCEVAISEATGKNYESILYLVDDCTS